MTVNDYTTTTSVKMLMPDTAWGTSYDAIMTRLITRASRLVDGLLHREPGAFAVGTQTTRYFDGSGDSKLLIGELAAVPSVVSVAETGLIDNANDTGGSYTAWIVNDYYPWPSNRVKEGKPFLRLDIDQLNGSKSVWYKYPRSVKITGYFGFATTSHMPEEIAGAVEIQTIRWFKRGQQAFQDVGAVADLSQLKYVTKLDPDIASVLMEGKFVWLP